MSLRERTGPFARGATALESKSVRVAMPLIPDKAAFQNNLASLPLVTYQTDETVIVDGSKTGRR